MKKKLLVLAPLMALVLTGCFSRTPTNKKKKSSSTTTAQTSTSGGSTTSGGSSGTSGGTSGGSSGGTSGTTSTPTPPGPTETHGTLDNPISVGDAKTIGNGLAGQSSQTVYDTINAYVRGVVQTEPEESSKVSGTYRFKVADSYTSDQYIMFYWGRVNSGATLPSNGDEVTLFGRIANYNNGGTIELAGKQNEIDDPLIMKSNHREVAISVNQVEHATVSSIPTKANTGDTVSFTVTADTGYSVDSVKVNGVIIPESSGSYSFKVADTSAILITIVEGQVTKSDLQKAYEAALALPNDTASTDAYTFSGVVVGIKGNSYYLQNDGYGMLVYNHATEGVAMGKNVSVTATIKQYNGLPETASVTSAQVTGDGTLPTAAEVTSMATLSALKVNVLANVAEATFVSKTKDWTSSNTGVRFTFTIGSDDIVLNMDKNGYNADKAAIFNAATVGDKYVFGNVLTNAFKTTAQLAFAGDTSTVQKITATPTSIEITSGSSVTVGDTLELTATVSPTGASQAVTWDIKSGSEYASLDDNVLTGTAAGTVVVTATATGTTVSSEKSITVNPQVLTNLEFKEDSYNLQAGDKDMSTEINFAPSTASKTLSFSIVETGKHSSITSAGVLTVSGEDTTFTVKVSDSVSSLNDTCTVNVVTEKVLSSISLDTSSVQKEFDVGDTFNYDNLVVTAHYSDSTSGTVTPTSVSTPDMSSAGEKTVTVSYTEGTVTKTADYTITVKSATEDHTLTWTATAAANLGDKIAAAGGTATGKISTGSYEWDYTRTLVALASGKSDYISWQGTTWIQLGSGNSLESISFTTSAIPGTIKSITVVAATAGTHTLSINVGGDAYLTNGALTTYSGTASATNPDPANCAVTATGTSSGAITITIASSNTTTRKAMVIRSITVVANY